MKPLNSYIESTIDPDVSSIAASKIRQGCLTKPPGSLGKVEELSIRLAGIYRTSTPMIGRKMIFTMAADHGITEEGVSAYPSEVTAQMVMNFANGGAAINVLAKHVDAEIKVIDVGVKSETEWPPSIIRKKVKHGTDNFAIGPAMTHDEARMVVEIGAELAKSAVADGVNAIAIGDMGIGNTTAASAITSVVTGRSVSDVTGRGTGIDDTRLAAKVAVIERSLNLNSPDPYDGLDVLSKIGGLEIGGLAGIIIGAAANRVPVFLDGFVSSSAALIADIISPKCRGYMIASHLSVEPGHAILLRHLGLPPLLDLNMRLGEGTGAALAMSIAEASCKILRDMATFEGAKVSKSIKEV
ncbi:MAG: nicotinate-nucleotide--dimethylbenzimidazole phosphoribosyltransferase [Thermoplasmata archaeon]|nr:nicotinate-nucleotide--dimethylbenzimidazole phosphoribosyltransferase [Thermoplasmata archaeon]MCJ7562328.1 nicotinate-nucleotide--dimethylbenzimidazole phosphoribosyltransferase [Thermoplasmata archaeon]